MTREQDATRFRWLLLWATGSLQIVLKQRQMKWIGSLALVAAFGCGGGDSNEAAELSALATSAAARVYVVAQDAIANFIDKPATIRLALRSGVTVTNDAAVPLTW